MTRLMTLLLGVMLASPVLAWESFLYPRDAASGQYQARDVAFGGRTWRLPDFSYAGYALGERALGSELPCTTRTLTATGDITAALQKAVDELGQAGGGTVLIPAGRYTVSAPISLDRSRVAVRGAGSAQTLLSVPSSFDSDDGLFTLGKRAGAWALGWVEHGEVLSDVVEPVRSGESSLRVADPARLAAGTWVVLRQHFWPAFSEQLSHGHWPSMRGFPAEPGLNRYGMFGYLRRVIARQGDRITLDAPIPWSLDPADNPVKLVSATQPEWIAPVSEVGVAGLSIEFAPNRNGENGQPGGSGLHFEGVRDAWAHDVRLRRVPRHGVRLNAAARVTISRVAAHGAQDYSGGAGYGFYAEGSQSLLVHESLMEDMRQGYTVRDPLTSSMVVASSLSAGARLGDDLHHGLAHAVLWDRHRSTHGSNLQAAYRGETSGHADETTGSVVVWNAANDGSIGQWWGGSLLLNPARIGWGLVIGGPGPLAQVFEYDGQGRATPVRARDGFQVLPPSGPVVPGSLDGNVLYEGLHRSGELQPASLYQSQLLRRTGLAPAVVSTHCGPVPASALPQPSVFGGPGELIYDGEHLGYAGNLYNCEQGCSLDAATPGQGGDGRSLRIQVEPGRERGPMLRGRLLETRELKSLRLRIYPVAAEATFVLDLSRQSLPEGSPGQSLGRHTIAGLAPGRWHTLEIPIRSFGDGAFNTVFFIAAGRNGIPEVLVDDVVALPATNEGSS